MDITSFIDYTRLEASDTPEAMEAFLAQVVVVKDRIAAVCVFPEWVDIAKRAVGSALPVAAVLNFPSGEKFLKDQVKTLDILLEQGVDEIDWVMPYRAFQAGDKMAIAYGLSVIRKMAKDCVLKTIVETGAFSNACLLQEAANLALAEGSDFLKTSTGKIAVGATPEAARDLLNVIVKSGNHAGLKVSGGIRTQEDALMYYKLAEEALGAPLTKQRFRIGASRLL